MSEKRIHNFNAGPAALPLPVLQEIQESFLNFKGSGMSITEVSHRSKWFDDVINDAIARIPQTPEVWMTRFRFCFFRAAPAFSSP